MRLRPCITMRNVTGRCKKQPGLDLEVRAETRSSHQPLHCRPQASLSVRQSRPCKPQKQQLPHTARARSQLGEPRQRLSPGATSASAKAVTPGHTVVFPLFMARALTKPETEALHTRGGHLPRRTTSEKVPTQDSIASGKGLVRESSYLI